MKKQLKRFAALIIAVMAILPASAQIERPKLVVGLVVDQMRWDYLYYYYDQYRTDGLRRLVDDGYSFENTMINYVPTVTAIGHSSIYTGSVPALTGIAGNNFYKNGKWVTSVSDPDYASVGSKASKEGQCSPRTLLASGLGDVLKIATDYKAKVIGVALKDRASILPAGHAADAAYWWDQSAGHFITSTYYMDRLPDWAVKANKEVQVKPGTDVKTSVPGVTKTFQMARAAVDGEALGQDSITDLLAISVSSTDAIGHTYGTRGQQNHDVFMELDKQVAEFLNYLDQKVGRGNYLLFLSADHGASHNHNLMKAHKLQAGGFDGKAMKPIVSKLESELGIKNLVLAENAGRIYLNHKAIEQSGKKLCDVKAKVIEALEQNDTILYAVDYDKVLTTSIPQPIRERIVNGYNKKRSGDIFYVAKAGWETANGNPDYIGTQHGQWNPYDAHIPFVLYGWHVKHGQTSTPTYIVDIAPTICEMLHIQMPNSCVGNAKSLPQSLR